MKWLRSGWRVSRVLFVVWVCFLCRGFFYASVFPLWEGYDEWAHYSFVEYLITHGSLPVAARDSTSREVEQSLKLLPLPWNPQGYPDPALTHDAYWRLAAAERQDREHRLAALPPEYSKQTSNHGPLIYEALQPPLYYWLSSCLLRPIMNTSLAARVIALRYWSVLIASAIIPVAFSVARRIFRHDGWAVGVVTVIVLMPEFLIDVARVGNDCLSAVIFSLLLYACIDADEGSRILHGFLIGATLGLGLLTKAYFLVAIPAVAVFFILELRAQAGRRRVVLINAVVTIGLATLFAGWWYARNLVLTKTLTGQLESVMLRNMSIFGQLRHVPDVPWIRAFDSILFSHIWFGGWSGLQVRSWMYHVFYWVIFLAAVGIAFGLLQSRRWDWNGRSTSRRNDLLILVVFYAFFWPAQAYNVLLLFLSKGVPTSMGWYMYALVTAEVVLAAAGLLTLLPRMGIWILRTGATCFALLDLYTVNFILIPYYTGLVSHRANGGASTFHISQLARTGFGEVFRRLQINKPEFLNGNALMIGWSLYVAATIGVAALVFASSVNASRLTMTRTAESCRGSDSRALPSLASPTSWMKS